LETPNILHALFPFIPAYVSYAFLASLLLIGVALAVRSRLSLVPSGLQNFMEVFYDLFYTTAVTNIGKEYGEKFYPLLGTIFLYVLVGNIFGLIPGLESPTSNLNVTLSLAIPVFLLYQFYGMKIHGFSYIKHFVGPIRSAKAVPFMMLMFCIEVISHIARPVTLAVRLFGNMIAKHMLLVILGLLAPWIIPVAILGLGTLIAFIQAYVFMLLTTLYLAGAVEEAH
jgi:F-type H+-transporting ATPase subunit a